MSQTIVTSDFKREFDAEIGRLLRHRFYWFLAGASVLFILVRMVQFMRFGALLLAITTGSASQNWLDNQIEGMRLGRVGLWIVFAIIAVEITVIVRAFLRLHRGKVARDQLLRFSQNLVLILGFLHIVVQVFVDWLGFPFIIAGYHLLACIFLPWTPQQAIRPIGPLLLLNALAVLIFSGFEAPIIAGLLIASVFAPGPGIFVAWFRHSRRMEQFRVRALQTRYGQMRRELVDARRIHESLFPPPVHSGPLRFEYRYQPMLQIGGDYLYARFSPGINGGLPAFNCLLLDVTGHGIAAALTVNRLYGEVERLFAEDPHAGPGEVLTALNRYVHLTLATHSVYVTALCVKIDQTSNTLEYASGGHPPAFLCGIDGRIEQLDSTSFVLGACAGQDFDPAVERRRFVNGDTLLAYTDGAIESRNDHGRMWGVAGLARCLANVHKPDVAGKCGLAGVVLSAVESWRYGPCEDDTLVVEITRPIGYVSTGDTRYEEPASARQGASVPA